MIGLADFKLIHCLMASDLRPGELFPRGGRVRHRSGGEYRCPADYERWGE